jgi:amidophosphoribosyltransferase
MMCGIIGIIGNKAVCEDLVKGLHALQHRGIQSSGMISYNSRERKFSPPIRGQGSSTEVFRHIDGSVSDNVAIGHNRYATSGDDFSRDAQPIYVQRPGLAIAHNGQIANYMPLREKLEKRGAYSFYTNCDVEPLLFSLAQNLIQQKSHQATATSVFIKEKLFPALRNIMDHRAEYAVMGAYAVVAIISHHGLLAFKDPHGVRPLCFAKKEMNGIRQYAFASETTAFNFLKGFGDFRELGPGEAMFIDFNFHVYEDKIYPQKEKFCPFEIVYFAQVDSELRGQKVYDARYKLGLAIASSYSELKNRVDAIMPVPKSPIPAAIALANEWKKPYGGVIPRPSHAPIRAFQQEARRRKQSIDEKFIFIRSHINKKRIGLVDDSVVRGETSKEVVSRLYELGAREVHLFLTYSPYIGICAGGIDTPLEEELLLNNGGPEDVERARKFIGATTLNFLPLKEMLKAVNLTPETACLGCTQKRHPFDLRDYSGFQRLRRQHREHIEHVQPS